MVEKRVQSNRDEGVIRHRDAGLRAALAAGLVLLAACGAREPSLQGVEAEGLLERGLAAHQAEEWNDAIRYLDRLVLEYPTHPSVQQARFYLADAYFGKEEYIAAAGRFTRLVEDYPRGEWADDARFKVCDAYRILSPDATLDQEYTEAAIDHCQSLVVYHPESEHVARANEIVDAMRNKLARKRLLSGEFYFKRRAYDSAILYFEGVARDFPTTSVAPEALLRAAEAYDRIGYEEEAAEARARLLREYPASEQARSLGSAPQAVAGS